MGALSQSTAGLNKFSKDVGGVSAGITSMAKSLSAPFAALAALVGGGAFLKGTISETVDWTVQAQKLARTLGVTTEQASAWGVAIKGVHGDTDTFLSIAAKMTRTLNTNETAFTNLGIATRDNQGHLRATQDVLLDTFDALSKMKEGTDRNVASTQIFGKGWIEVQKYLALTKGSLEAAREEAAKLNLIVGGDSVAAVNAYRKSSEDLDLTMKGLKIRIGQELMPVMTDFNEAAAEDGPSAITILGNCLKGLVEIVDGAWSGFKMFAIGLVGVVDAAARTIMTVLGTAWGFLKAGIPGAKAAFAEGNRGLMEDWKATLDALDVVGIAYAQRQQARWEGIKPYQKSAPSAPVADGHADTKEHKEKKEKKPPANVYQEEVNKLYQEAIGLQEKTTLAEKEAEEVEKARLVLQEQRTRYAKEMAAGTLSAGQGSALTDVADKEYAAKQIAIHRDIAAQREKIDAATLAKIGVYEKTGIEKQVEEAKKEFAEINAERQKAGLKAISQEVLMAKIAMIDTSKQNWTAGMTKGLGDFVKASSNSFELWRKGVSSILGGVQSSFATAFKGILSGQMTLGQAFKSIWSGIADAVISALANIAAEYITQAAASAIFAATTTTTSAATTAATSSQAAAETWAAYAPFPYVGQALALAQIGVMLGSIAAAGKVAPIVAHAVGGLIDQPTLALMGEAGREMVAPESSFKDWAGNLTGNIVAQERRSQAYQAQGGSYATTAASTGSTAGYGGLQVHLEGSVIAGESVESARIIGNMVKKGLDGYNRRNG